MSASEKQKNCACISTRMRVVALQLTVLLFWLLLYCAASLQVSSIVRDGKPQRFCQQCGRFHLLTDFDGNKRSCRAR
jgi:hypothetical protein